MFVLDLCSFFFANFYLRKDPEALAEVETSWQWPQDFVPAFGLQIVCLFSLGDFQAEQPKAAGSSLLVQLGTEAI